MADSRPTRVEHPTTPQHTDSGEASPRSQTGGYLRERTTDPDKAEEIISRHYLANRLHFPRSRSMAMDLAALRIGSITSGRLSYGLRVRQQTAEAQDFHVNMPVRGHAVSRCGKSGPVRTAAGQGLVFSPEEHAEIAWSPDCVQLCLMIPRAGLEAELERLLGRSVRSRLRFDFAVAPGHGNGHANGRHTVLDLVAQELEQPSGLATSQVAGRHLEGLVLDGLLLGQPHNYSEAAVGSRAGHRAGSSGARSTSSRSGPASHGQLLAWPPSSTSACGPSRQGSSVSWGWRPWPTSGWSGCGVPMSL